MAHYLVQATYAPSAMAGLIQSPQDRWKILRSLAEKVGGRIEGLWLAFGEYDVVAVVQMPDAQAMAAASMALSAGGGLRAIRTTALLTAEEAALAARSAAAIGYQLPSDAAAKAE